MDQQDDEFNYRPVEWKGVSRLDRRGPIAALVVVAFVALSLLKPWTMLPSGQAATTPAAASPSSGRSGAPVAVVSPAPSAADPCMYPATWLVVADHVDFGALSRTWFIAKAVDSAIGPGDTSIASVPVRSADVQALGFCSPGSLGGWSGTLWQQTSSDDVARWRVATLYDVPAGRFGAITGPVRPAGPTEGPATPAPSAWPSGRYVLEAHLAGSSRSIWIGLQVGQTD